MDLMLMHHYSTSTSTRLLPGPGAKYIWQVDVPAKAQDHVVLYHGMLALAAMDLAQDATKNNNPVQAARFRSRGLQHQQLALPLFRVLLAHDSAGDQNTIFLFAIMLVFLAFSSALSAQTMHSLDDIIDLFGLFRGPRTLWQSHRHGANKYLIDAMFPVPFHDPKQEQAGDQARFATLDHLAVDATSAEAVTHLKIAVRTFQMHPLDVRVMAFFPALVPEAFYAQVRAQQPAALAILSEYAAILQPYAEMWWIGRWGAILRAAIQDTVQQNSIQLPPVIGLLAGLPVPVDANGGAGICMSGAGVEASIPN